MVTCIGPLATINREPGQARKGAAAAVDSGAGVLAGVGRHLYLPPNVIKPGEICAPLGYALGLYFYQILTGL